MESSYLTNIINQYRLAGNNMGDLCYVNIMAGMSSYMESEDWNGLKEYYNREILSASIKFSKENDVVVKLYNLDIVELKSLMFLKLNYALELNIEISLEIMETVDKVGMKTLDLVRVVGILLDNAIEPARSVNRQNAERQESAV